MKSSTRLTLVFVAAGSLLVSCEKPKTTASATGAAAETAAPVEQAKAILGKLTSGIEQVVVALESVTDKASAATAAATIKTASAEISALGTAAKRLESQLSATEKTAMETAAEAGMKPLMGRMTEVMQKVMTNPETADVLMPAMNGFNKAMAPPADSPTPVPTK